MDKLIEIASCEDGSCCCLPLRSAIALISIMSLMASLIEHSFTDFFCRCCPMKHYVESMRYILRTMFQLSNLLLLLASAIENALLVNVYVCLTLGFVVMGLCFSIMELLYRFKHERAAGIVNFVPEVAFIFVISRCLPLVNTYIKYLDRLSTK